jgi:spermidine/putrescine transport system substrate-binding protein
MLPDDLKNDPLIFPAQDLLSPLEFATASSMTDPNRAELMARFKSA